MNEIIALILFWTSIGCLPAGLIGLAYGVQNRKENGGKFIVFGSVLALSHFVWYFRTLGLALADVTGGHEYPKWWLHILVGSITGLLMAILACNQNKSEPGATGQRR